MIFGIVTKDARDDFAATYVITLNDTERALTDVVSRPTDSFSLRPVRPHFTIHRFAEILFPFLLVCYRRAHTQVHIRSVFPSTVSSRLDTFSKGNTLPPSFLLSLPTRNSYASAGLEFSPFRVSFIRLPPRDRLASRPLTHNLTPLRGWTTLYRLIHVQGTFILFRQSHCLFHVLKIETISLRTKRMGECASYQSFTSCR